MRKTPSMVKRQMEKTMSETTTKRETKGLTREIYVDQYEAMMNIQKQTGETVASQVRKALDKELKLGAYKGK